MPKKILLVLLVLLTVNAAGQESPENVTLTFSSISSPVYSDGETISTGEKVQSTDYPYIASASFSIVNYGNFLKLSRPEEDKISMTQEGTGEFIVPAVEDIKSIESRENDITERELLDFVDPSFAFPIHEEPLVHAAYQFDHKVNASRIPGATEVVIENTRLTGNEFILKLTGR